MASQPQARPGEDRLTEPADFFQVGQEDPRPPRLYLRYDLFRAIEEFALRDTSREMAGLLLGHVAPDGSFLQVEEAVECGVAEDEGGRFSPRVFQYARRIARHRYPGMRILGWFHTHPGSGLDLSDEEREVHRSNFPEAWQVLYVEDPVRKDRTFHLQSGGQFSAARGFRIYGKEAFKEAVGETPTVRPDEHLRERYLERSLERIQRMLRKQAWQFKDTLLVLLLAANLAVTWWRTSAPAEVPVLSAP
ncbi:MAG: Mov34/MPN/PAD-1 family protein, partial [Candidatus Eremiobacterota bacterium]